MNKKHNLKQKAKSLLQQVKNLEILEQRRVGKLTLRLYENGAIRDEELKNKIAKIISGEVQKRPRKSKIVPEIAV